MLLHSFISGIRLECRAGWFVRGIAPIPGPRLFQTALGKVRRSPDTCRPGNHLCPSLQNQSTGEFTDFPQSCCLSAPRSWVFQAATVPHAPVRAGREQQLAHDSEKLRSPRCTQPGRFSAGSDSYHSQAWALPQSVFKCFKTRTWNSDAWTRAPTRGFKKCQLCCWESQARCLLYMFFQHPVTMRLIVLLLLFFHLSFSFLQPFVKISLLCKSFGHSGIAPVIASSMNLHIMVLTKLCYTPKCIQYTQ